MTNTISKMMQFFGDSRDEQGLPDPFFVYQIYATDPGPDGLSAIATILPVDGGQPEHIPLAEGDRHSAMAKARDHLLKRHGQLKHIG